MKQKAVLRSWTTVALCASLLISGMLLAACGGGGGSSSSTETTTQAGGAEEGGKKSASEESGAIDGEGMKIAFLAPGFGNSYSDALLQAARNAGSKFNVSVEGFDGKFDPSNQASECQDAVTSGRFKAIIVSPLAGPSLIPCAAQAEGAGIPLVSVSTSIGADSKLPTEPGVVANVLAPLSMLYGELGKSIPDACKGFNPCKVVELSALEVLPEPSHILSESLKEVEAENPGIEVVAEVEGGLEVAEGQAAMQDILAKGTEFNVSVIVGAGSNKGAMIALKSAGKEVSATGEGIRMVSSGGTKEQMAAIKAGEIWGTEVQLPTTEGESAVEVATLAGLGKPFPKSTLPQEVLGIPVIPTVENKAEWEGFTGQYSQ